MEDKNSSSGMVPRRKMVPLVEGIFTLPSSPDEKPALLGTRCKNCGQHYLYKRDVCLNCGKMELEEVTLNS